MNIRLATTQDLPRIQSIYDQARAFMEQTGNPTQWAGGYPPLAMLKNDISCSKLYVCEEEGAVQGVFYFAVEPDPTYAQIEGAWLAEGSYGVIHRIATDRSTRGVGRFCAEWAFEQACALGATAGIRIDTHEDNAPMQAFLDKMGYTPCGTIYVADGTPRIAFQRLPR